MNNVFTYTDVQKKEESTTESRSLLLMLCSIQNYILLSWECRQRRFTAAFSEYQFSR